MKLDPISRFEVVESFGFGLLIEPSLLGTSKEFELNGQRYYFGFPREPNENSIHMALEAPISRLVRKERYWETFFKEDFFPWGDEYESEEIDSIWRAKSVNIRRIIYGFEIDGVESGFTPLVEGSIQDWDQFWARMKNWMEVLTNQDSVNGSTIPSKNRKLEIWAERGDEEEPSLNGVTVIQAEYLIPGRPLTNEDFDFAFNKAIWGIDALLEELLIRDARRALHTLDYRRAIVDTATAIEVVMSKTLGYTRTDRKTLGSLVDDWMQRGYKTPQGLCSDFVDLRNEVVHNGRTPTRDEGVDSLVSATSLIEIAKSLK